MATDEPEVYKPKAQVGTSAGASSVSDHVRRAVTVANKVALISTQAEIQLAPVP